MTRRGRHCPGGGKAGQWRGPAAALGQAGGKPLVIGGVVGTVKAVGSLIVVLLFVREFV
jgi:hypothetical protein